MYILDANISTLAQKYDSDMIVQKVRATALSSIFLGYGEYFAGPAGHNETLMYFYKDVFSTQKWLSVIL